MKLRAEGEERNYTSGETVLCAEVLKMVGRVVKVVEVVGVVGVGEVVLNLLLLAI